MVVSRFLLFAFFVYLINLTLPITAGTNSSKDKTISGRVFSKDSNSPLPGVNILIIGTNLGAATDSGGHFLIYNVPPGIYEIKASMVGYISVTEKINVEESGMIQQNFFLIPRLYDFPVVEIIGSNPSFFLKIPGSGETVGKNVIQGTHPVGMNEILRKVPGVYVRDEDGFGIRPNIGIRGLFPTRSSKVLLLEDGIPITQAPYGDPAAYYHPPISRFNRVEILKGSGQIIFGPQTIGGVINYLTPQPPSETEGMVKIITGNRNYLFGQFDFGSNWNGVGFMASYSRKQGNLARSNTSTRLNDLSGKVILEIDKRSKLSIKGNVYEETSNITYAGITQIEFEEDPFQNQFKNDWFFVHRYGAHIIFDRYMGDNGSYFALNLYGQAFLRDWWRQGNNGGTNSANPGNQLGVRTVLNPSRNDGRNRKYYVWGIEPRFRFNHQFLGFLHETDLGIRVHFETQDRKQIEGNSPFARTGVLREDNLRKTVALASFIQDKIFIGDKWTISGGLRMENIHYSRTNRLNGASGRVTLVEFIPGVGATFNPMPELMFYGGLHRGFAPPRVEDVISNTDGSSIELEAEKSWNLELGIRTKLTSNIELHATLFEMNFENQIIPSSLAGGSGTNFTNAGKTIHRGAELKSSVTIAPWMWYDKYLLLNIAYTYLPVAEFRGVRYSTIIPTKIVTGNRLTYAPKHLVTASVGYMTSNETNFYLEAVYVSDQFSDDLNTVNPSPSGRQGIIPEQIIWNVSVNYTIKPINLTAVFAVKNLFDKVYIVDRSRGILPGNPRLFQFGIEWKF